MYLVEYKNNHTRRSALYFIGLVKTLDLLIFFLDSVKFEHPSANAVKNSPNKEYLTSEHRLRIRSCDWYILEEYSNYGSILCLSGHR